MSRSGFPRAVWLCAALVVTSVPSAVAAQGGDVWARAASPDGAFSVETPCSAAEVAASAALPDGIAAAATLDARARVLCIKDTMLFVASIVEERALPADGPALFDAALAQVRADKTAEGHPTITTVDGRRALMNRQTKGGEVARTGFVEVSRSRIVLLIAGVRFGSSLSAVGQDDVLDRFTRSIRVTAR